MDFYLIVVGLFMIAEGGPNDSVDLLFLRSDEAFQDACGVPMAEHRLALKHWFPSNHGTGLNSIEEILNGTAEVSIEITSSTPTKLALQRWDEILDMATLVKDSKIRPECQGPDAFSTCETNGEPLLAARMRLTGGFLSPIEYHLKHEVDLPSALRPGVTRPWSFSRVLPQPAAGKPSPATAASPAPSTVESNHSQRLFNGILYQVETPPGAEVTVHWGPHPVRLDPIAKDLCSELGSTGPCRVAVIYNIPPHSDLSNHSTAADACKILSKEEDEECSIDRHFNLNYYLLENPPPPEEALIPVLCGNYDDEGELPLGSRCIPPKTDY